MNDGRRWIAAVVILLAGNAAAVTVLAVLGGDPTPRVEPDYYRRAAAWDQTMAAQQASLALDWTAEVHLSAAAGGGTELEVVVHDDTGAPLGGAAVIATVRHRSRADRAVVTTPRERPGGRYLAELALTQPGLHVVEIEIVRGADRFETTQVVEAPR